LRYGVAPAVAAEPKPILWADVSNLLVPVNIAPSDWDGSAGGGYFGGSRT
jgi:hypothetical protein